ncbi:MAG: threonine/serine dehydratase [Planctomycetota bacterium]
MTLTPPKMSSVLDARRVIRDKLPRTPLYRWPVLCRRSGLEIFVKHENHLPIGAFKVRGGLYLMSKLSEEERARGVITASTGNHGQSIAYGAHAYGVRAVIVLPEKANPAKVESMEALGAELRFVGKDFDEAREYVERVSQEEGLRLVHTANEPDLIAGVGTFTLEMLEEVPDLDVIYVALGGGSAAASACLVTKTVAPHVRVVAVQSAQAPAAYRSWREGRLVEAEMSTFAEGVATRTAFELTQSILRESLSDFVLVDDDEIRSAMRTYLETTRNLVEASGAVSLAGALHDAEKLQGQRVGVVLSGANASIQQLSEVLD